MNIIYALLEIAGSLGIFIYGMKLMSEGLQKVAGNKMRDILKGMTKNRFLGVLTGFTITALIQSSSAATVMVVSFVNAGLLTLTESFGVIMGANIGTTITLWIVSILGFKVKMTPIAIGLIGLFFPLMFAANDKLKNVAEFILGFGILFIGLEFLKNSVPDIQSNPEAVEFLKNFTNLGPNNYGSILLFVFVGTVLTVVVQSSSAASAITLTLVMSNWIPFELGAAMILGENIGTTITANLASLVGNVHAKRSARFHLLFNLMGVVWVMFIFIPFTGFIESIINTDLVSGMASVAGEENEGMALALFHTLFNLLNVVILFAFVPIMGKWVVKMVPTQGDDDEEFRLQHISTGLMATPSLSMEEAKKEMRLYGKLIDKMAHNVYDLFFEKQKSYKKLIEKIKDREDLTDKMDLELNHFLAKVSESDVSNRTSKEIKQLLSMSSDLERIADIYYQISKSFERLKKEKVELPGNAKEELREMMKLVMTAVSYMKHNIDDSKNRIPLAEIVAQERKINAQRKEVFTAHFERLEKGTYTPKQGVLFIDFINRCERIGDHIMNVHEALLDRTDLFSEFDDQEKKDH